MKFCFDWPTGFLEKTFEECGQQKDDGVCLYYKLTYDSKGSGELKIVVLVKAIWMF